jgi:hypothetical protein
MSEGNKIGRPTKYLREYDKQAYKLCLLGFTNKQLAEFFDVSDSTIDTWLATKKSFLVQVRAGRTVADSNVVAAMYKRAIGFKYNEVTFEKIDGQVNLTITPDELITVPAYKKKIVTKLVIPDTGAQVNWLTNRQKELWRRDQEVKIDFDKLTDEELDIIINRLILKQKTA